MLTVIMTAVETASGIGTAILTSSAIAKAVPSTLNKVEKACVGVATVTTSIAVDQVVCREVRGFCKDVDREVRRLKRSMRGNKHHHSHQNDGNKETKEEVKTEDK